MAKLRPTQFFNHTKEKTLSSKQCVEIFTGVVIPSRYFIFIHILSTLLKLDSNFGSEIKFRFGCALCGIR